MTTAISNNGMTDQLQRDNEALRERLQVLEETLQSIRHGKVDCLIFQTPQGPEVFTLVDANTPYRTFVEEMQHGAATIGPDGTILYCNHSLPAMLRTPIERVVGAAWHSLVADESADASKRLLARAAEGKVDAELNLLAADGAVVPVAISANPPSVRGAGEICLVITDLTERRRAEESLLQQNAELERTNRLFVGRETRMIELKRQVNELAKALGRPEPYDASFADEGTPREPKIDLATTKPHESNAQDRG